MATIYFTNNADSGDGSLRSAWSSAEDGDIIMPDTSAFQGDEIEILLASSWAFKAFNLTLDGGTKRIILNGQSAVRFGTGSSASIENSFRNVDFKNFSYTGTGSTAVQYPVYISGLGSLTFTNCRFYGNQCATGATSAFIRTTNLSSASIVLNNCIAYNNSASETARFIQSNTGTFEVNGCTLISSVYGNNLTNNSSILSDDSDFENAGFVDASNNDYRLQSGSPYLTGGTLAGTDFLGHARTGSKGAYDGSWFVANEAGTYASGDVACDYAELANGVVLYFIAPSEGQTFVVKRAAYFGGNNLLTSDVASEGNVYVALPYQAYDETAVEFEDVLLARYDCGVANVDAQVVGRTIAPLVTSSALGYALEIQYDGNDYWERLNPTNLSANPAPISMETLLSSANGEYLTSRDKSFRIRAWDGAFHPSDRIPRTYYLANPQATSASFASQYDWSVFASRSESCNVAPSIAGCTFVCIE